MKLNTRQAVAVGVVGLFVLGGGVAVVAADAPAIDRETTVSPDQSDLYDGATVSQFNASADAQSRIEINISTRNPEVEIIGPNDITHATVTNASFEQSGAYDKATDTDGDNEFWHWKANLSHDALATVPIDAGGQTNVTLRVINNASADNPDTVNATVTLNGTDERTVVLADGNLDSGTNVADTDTAETDPLNPLADPENTSTVDSDDVTVSGDTTDVLVVYEGQDVAAPYETAAEETQGLAGYGLVGVSEYSAGDHIGDHIVRVDSTPYVVYNSEPVEEVLDKSGATYASYETVNGEPVHRITLGDTGFEDADSVDVETNGNMELAPWNRPTSFEGGLLSGLLG